MANQTIVIGGLRFLRIMKTLFPSYVAICGLLTVEHPLYAQGLTAFAPSTYNVGFLLKGVVAVDVNGDGKPDLVSADTKLMVLTNDGGGNFGFHTNFYGPIYPADWYPGVAVAADVNSDGKPDLIFSEYFLENGFITIFTNNGTGNFGQSSFFGMGYTYYPNCMVTADVNGDGKPDLIIGNANAGTLTLMTNNGSGIFGSNATLNLGIAAACVVAGDVNGDGKPDLITADYGNNILMVWTNNGSGIFGSNATLNVGSEPSSVAAADINNDGRLDLISANLGDNTLTVLTNNGSGIFGSNATLHTESEPASVIAVDLYRKGKLDLICANAGDNSITVLTNDGSGVFGYNATLNAGFCPVSVVATDVNGDGKPDLVAANYSASTTNTLTVLTQVTVGPPTLAIAPTNGNGLVVSWSSFSPGFTFLTNGDLCTTNWAPAGYAISTNNGTNQSVILTSPPPGNLFFRLSQ